MQDLKLLWILKCARPKIALGPAGVGPIWVLVSTGCRIQRSNKNNNLPPTTTQQLGFNNSGLCLPPHQDLTTLGLITRTKQLWVLPPTSPWPNAQLGPRSCRVQDLIGYWVLLGVWPKITLGLIDVGLKIALDLDVCRTQNSIRSYRCRTQLGVGPKVVITITVSHTPRPNN